MGSRRRASERLGLAAVTLLTLGAACRQTVVLDPDALPDGGASGSTGAAGTGPLADASGMGGDHGGPGGQAGSSGGMRFDGGRPEGGSSCGGGQIQSLPISMRSPDIILSVDRSAGMQSWFGTATRLQVIQQQVRALVSKYRVVKFGYEEFPAVSNVCLGGQGCCSGDVALPSYNNLRVIERVFNACDNGGVGCDQPQRPIADALSKIYDTFTATVFSPTDTGHRYVLLLTSGEPTCMGSDATASPCSNAVAQVTRLSRAFINTAVFGISDTAAGSSCLDQLALYGGLDSGGASPLYHLARTPTELSAALAPVVETIAEEACKIDVRSPPMDPTKVQLLFDGVLVPSDGVDGWTFDQDTTVTLTVHGSYCDKLIQSVNKVDLIAGCPQIHI
jgi:hypothetical protein